MTRVITGDPSWDRQITAPTDTGQNLRKEGSERRPFAAGLFQTVTDITWVAKKFAIASGGGDFGSVPDNAFWGQFAGLSSDGLQWNNVVEKENFGEVSVQDSGSHIKCWFDACIRGKGQSDEPVVFIGAGKVVSGVDSSGNPSSLNLQMAFMTFDEGASFQDLDFPPNGAAASTSTTTGTSVVGYNKKEKTFYLSYIALEHLDTQSPGFVSRSYSYVGGAWNLLQEVDGATALTPWPKKTIMSNGNGVTGNPSFPRASIGSSDTGTMTISNSDGDTFEIGMDPSSATAITVNGASVPIPQLSFVSNLAAGNGVIIVTGEGFDDGQGGFQNVILRSDDFGDSFEEILPELKQGDQGFLPRPSFS